MVHKIMLEELGLSKYEEKVYTALSRIGSGNAREISNEAEVPLLAVRHLLQSTIGNSHRRAFHQWQLSTKGYSLAWAPESHSVWQPFLQIVFLFVPVLLV